MKTSVEQSSWLKRKLNVVFMYIVDIERHRHACRGLELVTALVATVFSAMWINAWSQTNGNIIFSLFTALTSCVICALLLIIHCVGDKEWMLLLIEFLMNVLFCIFWLISSILSTLEFISVSNWPALEKDACGAVGPLQVGPPNYCKAYSRRYALNALCAVSWTAWIFWLYSIYISISIDIRKKKIFVDLSKKFKKSSRSRTCLSNMEEANPSASSTAYQNTDIWKLLGSRLLHATGIKTSAPSSKSVSSDKYSSSQEDGSSEDAKTNRAPAEKLIQG